ncbi:major capsid protein [Methylobacillus sp. Pita1]|uniref:major capsid protein n=1 Tax=Methylobacillus sp. Pita1 TaxID=3382642 RepID=UPI0038B6790B
MFKKIAGVVVAVAPLSAFAEVPASVTTAIGDAVTDVGTIGAAILGVVIGIVVFNWLRRVIK